MVDERYEDGWYRATGVIPASVPVEESRLTLDERLLLLIESHMAAEKESLDEYRRLVEITGDSMISFVVTLILDDELHHHDLQERMVASLRRGLLGVQALDALPARAAPPGADIEALIDVTRNRLAEERRGTHELRRLAKEDNRLYSGLFTMLLDMMAKDSEKHELMLKFLLKRLEAARLG